MIKVKVKKLVQCAKLPTYATDGAGAFDLYAVLADAPPRKKQSWHRVEMEEVTFIRTGLAFEIPDGHVMLVFGRSGHTAKYGTSLANCVGVVDSDYRGEVTIMLRAGHSGLDVMPGDRIAQAIVIPRPRAEFELVDELSDTDRGVGGLGSTGA